jgi:hypothetical protein
MLIGLIGHARSGKDTIANFLVEDYDFLKVAFADPMREALMRLNPVIRLDDGLMVNLSQALKMMEWDMLKSRSPDIRGLMQRFGTEVGREMFGENFWVEQAMKYPSTTEDVVFSDVRYPNEAEAITSKGGILIRITKPNVGPVNSHLSDNALIDYPVNFTINNSGTLAELSAKVNILTASLRSWTWDGFIN